MTARLSAALRQKILDQLFQPSFIYPGNYVIVGRFYPKMTVFCHKFWCEWQSYDK
jgi:hypothetical protein